MALASLMLVMVAPVLLAAGLIIKLNSPGPVFFRQVRVGRAGKPFRIFKFRTMVVNAESLGGPDTSANDPRITKIGKVLRRYNLDELPQFINVLKGEMSIVGPRPEVPQYVELFSEEEKAILTVRPGITDWATIWIRNEGKVLAASEDPERAYLEMIWPEKRAMQLEYVKNHSVRQDFHIMLKTLQVHLFDRFKSDARL